MSTINYGGSLALHLSAEHAEMVAARVERYLRKWGGVDDPAPLPEGEREEVRQQILADWLAADWTDLEWKHLQKRGRPIFSADMEPLAAHMRGALFMCGRSRRNRWRPEGLKGRGADGRRRDLDEFSGASAASRSADPARMLAAVEDARGGLWAVSDRARRSRRRWVKSRNSSAVLVSVEERFPTYTRIRVERVVKHNFRQTGTVPNRLTAKTRKRLPKGTTAASLLEALQG